MRVLAAKFPDRRVASAVREALRRRLSGSPLDVDIAPLANAEQPSTDETLLAGRFLDHDAALAAELLKDAGGEIVANIDESWTLPRSPLPISGRTWGSSARRNQLQA